MVSHARFSQICRRIGDQTISTRRGTLLSKTRIFIRPTKRGHMILSSPLRVDKQMGSLRTPFQWSQLSLEGYWALVNANISRIKHMVDRLLLNNACGNCNSLSLQLEFSFLPWIVDEDRHRIFGLFDGPDSRDINVVLWDFLWFANHLVLAGRSSSLPLSRSRRPTLLNVGETDSMPALIETIQLLIFAPLAFGSLWPGVSADATHRSTHTGHYFRASLHSIFGSSKVSFRVELHL